MLNLSNLKPTQVLTAGYRAAQINKDAFNSFLLTVSELKTKLDPNETEEHCKTHLRDFVKAIGYDGYAVNTKDTKDMVIHLGADTKANVGVILEVKRPANVQEMLTQEQPNKKALHELILYFMRERDGGNTESRHLVVTNVNAWFVFDAQGFDKAFYQNTKFKKLFTNWRDDVSSTGSNTDQFYKLCKAYLENNDVELEYTHLSLDDIPDDKSHSELDEQAIKQVANYYRLLSPRHLLKERQELDPNSLQGGFYRELLHILGLYENTGGDVRRIERLPEEERNSGSLVEAVIDKLETQRQLGNVESLELYGETHEEQLLSVAMELVMQWVNRLLFLKLLEAQLVGYHHGDKSHLFLTLERIESWDDLDELFFQVLAKKTDERKPSIADRYTQVPYLNSSLFETSPLEIACVTIGNLTPRMELPIWQSTALRDKNSKKLESGKSIRTLEYLIRFLDRYDFGSEGDEVLTDDNRPLITSSVLGLVFEKINNFKDGAHFTPASITMYMARESLRAAVVNKFNSLYPDLNCSDFQALYNTIDRIPPKEASDVISQLKIVDPSVGSGHFLVSSLNELIAIKSELGVLVDADGNRLREHYVVIDNDELVVLDRETDDVFKYTAELTANGIRKVPKQASRIQKTLFHEKQTLIENCLFGVDINPNSVNICRLRLWIELLKNAYYTSDSDYLALEVLPNIDVNIVHGDGVVARYEVEGKYATIGRSEGTRKRISEYLDAFKEYHSVTDADEKEKLRQLMRAIRESLNESLKNQLVSHPKQKEYEKLKRQFEDIRYALDDTSEKIGGEMTATERKKHEKDLAKVEKKLGKLQEEFDAIESVMTHALEWRYYFPQVLDPETLEFVGFDVVIGNPPYIRQEALGSELKTYLKTRYTTYAGTADLLVYFIERGMQLLKDGGTFAYIVSNKWMRARYGKSLREFLRTYAVQQIVDFGDLPVFESATTYPAIIQIQKAKVDPATHVLDAAEPQTMEEVEELKVQAPEKYDVPMAALTTDSWTLTSAPVYALLEKLRSKGMPLGEYVEGKIYRGVLTGYNEAFVIDADTRAQLIADDPRSAEVIKPFLRGRDIKRYRQPVAEQFVLFTRRGIDIDEYPAIKKHLSQYRESLEPKPKDFKGRSWPGRKPGPYKWYEIQDTVAYYEEFEKAKIVIPAITKRASLAYDTQACYSNDKTTIIPTDDLVLLALLNSRVMDAYMFNISSTKQNGYFEYKPMYLSQLPVLENVPNREAIAELAEKLAKAYDESLEAELDALVYAAYDLTPEEIALVEAETAGV